MARFVYRADIFAASVTCLFIINYSDFPILIRLA